MLEKLRELGIRDDLIREITEYRETYPVEQEYGSRIPKLEQFYYGKEVWEQAITAILCGENILLAGPKATGKSLFAENLAGVFARPRWDVSFHVNMDAASLIGMDTFRGGEVSFRPGPVYTAAKAGGFAILDEINMAKSEAMAVLHATLDFRRTIDVPGYERMELHKKCENGEISSKALDLRGLLGAVGLMEKGLDIFTALDMGITNKTFDTYEQTLIRDTIRTRISKKMVKKDLFVK